MTHTELRALRIAHGLSQKALGALVGYSANYISRLERGVEGGKPFPITARCEKVIRTLLPDKKKKSS